MAEDGVAGLARRIRDRELSPVEAVQAFLNRIDRLNPLLGAYIHVRADDALAEARAAERAVVAAEGSLPRLTGVPIAVKDNIDLAGTATTAGSASRADPVAADDAEVVRRLRDAGAIVLGKLNLHEWAFGATGLNTAFGSARNPWDRNRTPGGSSSGAGAAVSAGLAAGALGTDSGGSIRIPASLCGLTGLRPTIGRVSTRGVVPLTWTFDTVGPLTRDAEDAELLLTVIAGYDPDDPRSCDVEPPRTDPDGVDGLRIGLLGGWFADSTHPAVLALVDDAMRDLEAAGAQIDEIALEDAHTIRDRMNEIIQADAAAAHAERLAHAAHTIAPDVRSRLESGAALSAAAYARATDERRRFRRRLKILFADVDVLATATTPITAPSLADCHEPEVGRTLTRLVYPFSFGGTPSISIPCGVLDGLPVGMQLIAPDFRESRLLRVARTYQAATDWHSLRPPS